MSTKLTEQEENEIRRYAYLKVKIRDMTKEMKDLNAVIREPLIRVDAENEPVGTEEGVVSLRPRRVWVYGEEIVAMEEKIKKQKLNDQATGNATFETVFDVYFK